IRVAVEVEGGGAGERTGVSRTLRLRPSGHQLADVDREHRRSQKRNQAHSNHDERESPLVTAKLPEAVGHRRLGRLVVRQVSVDAIHGHHRSASLWFGWSHWASFRISADAPIVSGAFPSADPLTTSLAIGLRTM